LSEKITSSFLYPLLDGLEAVHDAQFIHRDIKPANIFIRESGSPILLDFGGARQILGRRRQTLSSMVSDGYAPIEQYQPGGQLGEWTDIYGVGAVLYHCAVGSSPIAAPDRQTEIIRNGRDPLIPPSELAHDYYSADFLCGIEQGLQLDIEQRPQNIAAWKNFLSRLLFLVRFGSNENT
jgi:serine/threonine protein kinase